MATIDVRRSHKLEIATAKERAEELAKDMQSKMGIQWRWDGDRIRFDAPSGMAKGVTGTVSVSTSEVRVEIDLPFLMRPMKGMVEGKVNEKLNKLIG
jgi:putative polyhydroxyalkanoate system protein